MFTSTNDPDYQALLAFVAAGEARLREIKRFDMAGFVPRADWVREMRRYGILSPTNGSTRTPLNVYEVERRYWESLWHHPEPLSSPPTPPSRTALDRPALPAGVR